MGFPGRSAPRVQPSKGAAAQPSRADPMRQKKKRGPEGAAFLEFGGARRDRTADLLHAMQALSQLSYGPMIREEREF